MYFSLSQDFLPDGLELVTQEELDIHEDLVVAGPSGVDLLAHLAELPGQQQLHLGMDVLDIVFEDEGAGLDAVGDAPERRGQRRELVRAQQADMLQHLDVRQRALHVIAGEPAVQDPVVADRETVYCLRCGSTFIPKSSHTESQ